MPSTKLQYKASTAANSCRLTRFMTAVNVHACLWKQTPGQEGKKTDKDRETMEWRVGWSTCRNPRFHRRQSSLGSVKGKLMLSELIIQMKIPAAWWSQRGAASCTSSSTKQLCWFVCRAVQTSFKGSWMLIIHTLMNRISWYKHVAISSKYISNSKKIKCELALVYLASCN